MSETSDNSEAQAMAWGKFGGTIKAMRVRKVSLVGVCTDEEKQEQVSLLFSHADFPEARFGYRCLPPGQDPREEIWFAEELATGALHRAMRNGFVESPDGICWLQLNGQLLVQADYPD